MISLNIQNRVNFNMVKKSRNKSRGSSLACKKSKGEMKHARKFNYKKKKENTLECCVCMEEINDMRDNVITCGKVNHPLCRDCKLKCDKCPMCRSHSIKAPVSQEFKMKVLSRSSKIENKYPKKSIKVEVIAIGDDFLHLEMCEWDGIYYPFRKTAQNYLIYKMIDREKYIINERSQRKHNNSFQWVFKYSPDNDVDIGWVCKTGKLFGYQRWDSYWNPYDYDDYITYIHRI